MRSAVVQRTAWAAALVVGAAVAGAGCVAPPEPPSQEFLSMCKVEYRTLKTAAEAHFAQFGTRPASGAELVEAGWLENKPELYDLRLEGGVVVYFSISACPEPVR